MQAEKTVSCKIDGMSATHAHALHVLLAAARRRRRRIILVW